MSQPLMHSWLSPTLSMRPMAGLERNACYDRRVMVWEKEVGDLWGSRLGQTGGSQGWLWLCTLNAHIAFWEGRLTSSPLLWNKKQQQERNSPGLGALLHILNDIQCYRKRWNSERGNVIMLEQYLWLILGHSSLKHSYARWNKSAGIYKQTMGKVTELQSFFHNSA